MSTEPGSQHRIWAHFQNAGVESFQASHPRLDFLLRQMARRAAGSLPRLLNIGIGDGHLEREAKLRGWDIHSLDPDEQAVARLATAAIEARVGQIESLPYADSSFDFVVASEVLEHLTVDQRKAGLLEIRRVLRPGGCFLGTVPHAENLSEQQAVCPHCGEMFHRWGHQASFTLEGVRQMLEPTYRIEQVSRTAFVDLWGRGIRGFLKGAARWALAKAGEPIAVPTIWWVAARPRVGIAEGEQPPV